MALMRFNSKTFLPESAVKQTQVKGIMAGSHLGWCSSTAFSILTDKQAFSKLVYINMLKKNHHVLNVLVLMTGVLKMQGGCFVYLSDRLLFLPVV